MKEEDRDTDDSDSTVLLTNYNDKPEKNEAKRRRLSSVYDRSHSDQNEDENKAPDDANANRQTNAPPGKKKGRSWRVSRYLASIGNSNPQNKASLEAEIICLDSDDEVDSNVNQRQGVNVAVFNQMDCKNNPSDEVINAKLKVLKPSAINPWRATSNVCSSDVSQKINENEPMIRVLKPSAINARRSTTSLEENYNILDKSKIPMHTELGNVKEIQQGDLQAVPVSESQNADSNAVNVDINNSAVTTSEEEPVAPMDLIKTDHLSKSFFAQNVNNDTLLDAKGNKRLTDDTTTEPKRSKTELFTSDKGIEKTVSINHSSDIHTSIEEDNNQRENKYMDIKNKNEVRNNVKAQDAHALRNSEVEEPRNERDSTEVLNQQDISPCVLNITRKESLNMQKNNIAQSSQILKEARIGTICNNQHTDKVIDEQDQINPKEYDKQETRTIQNENQTGEVLVEKNIGEADNKEHSNKTHMVQEVNNLTAETRIVEEIPSGSFEKVETGKVQELQATETNADITGTDEAPGPATPATNPEAFIDNGAEKQKPKPTHPELAEMVQTAIKELKEKRGSSLKAIKTFIAVEYNVDGEKLAPLIRQYLMNAVKSRALIQNKRKGASGSGEEVRSFETTKENINVKQSERNSNQELEEQTSNALDNSGRKVQNEGVLSKLSNEQATNHTREEQISKASDNCELSKEMDLIEGKEQSEQEQVNRNVHEQYDTQATSQSQKEEGTSIAQETGEIQDQRNMGRIRDTSVVQDGSYTTEPEDKTKRSNEKHIVKEAHESQKTEQTTRTIVNNHEEKKTDDQDVSTGQDSRNDKISSESHEKDQTNIVCDELKATESHSEQCRNTRQRPVQACLRVLRFQIQFFTILKQNVKTGVYPEFAASFDNILQILKANHASGTALTELVYCCPKCSHVSTFSSSLPITDIEEPIDRDSSKKCNICSGIENLYITYMRRYDIKKVSTTNKERMANGGITANDCLEQPVECSEKTEKRKSNEPYGEATDPKRIKAAAEHSYVQNDMHLSTNTSKDNISVAIVNLAVEDSNGATNRSDNTPEKSSKKTTRDLQIKTSTVVDNANARCMHDQSDAITCAKSYRENRNENVGDVEILNNGANNEIQKSAAEGRENKEESNDNVNMADTEENNAINESNIQSLRNCFIKIKNLLTSKEGQSKKVEEPQNNNAPLMVSGSVRKNRVDKIPEGHIDNRPDIEYICHVCSCIYVYPSKFLSHLRQHNILNQKIPEICMRRKCKRCNLTFKSKESFNKHVKVKHSNKYAETVAENLSIHNEENVNSETGSKQTNKTSGLSKLKYRCTKCDKILKTDYAARNHRNQKHPEFRYQKLYKKIANEDQNDKQDNINDIENEELSESEDDDDPTYIEDEMRSGDEENSPDEFEESCDSDSSLCDDDDQTNERDKEDKAKTSMNSSEEIVREAESRNDKVMNDNKLTRRVYKCLLCKVIFSTDWSARKHRTDEHPYMKGAPLFQKIQLDTSTADRHLSENEPLSSNISEEVNQNSLRRHSTESDTRNDTDKISRNSNLARSLVRDDEDYSSDIGTNDAKQNEKCNKDCAPINNEENEEFSDRETVNASEYTIRKNNERIRKLFDESQSDEIAGRAESQSQTIINTETEEADSEETIKASEQAVKKKNERVSKLFGDEDEASASGKISQKDCDPRAPCNQEVSTRLIDNSNQDAGNEDSSDRCDVTDETETASKGQTIKPSTYTGGNVNGAKAKTRDNDQFEIDMIDNLLEEYDSQAKDQQVASNEENNYDRVDQTSQVSVDKMQINTSQKKYVQEKTCLDKIQISNVTSIADKIYLFVCQECQYATDIYDDTISHCQNHFNLIQDPVTYCNICQINYDKSCFQRHELTHDTYLTVIKIKFSYLWLFSNWNVFENNNIPLRIAEDFQVKSIYKTFSIKMSVRENGDWHSALYLCDKCNICIPHAEIEKHVRNKCPSQNYLCNICDYAFLSHEMLEHHKIYHKDNSQPFKIIIFNDKNDDEFNLKLLQAKTGRLDDGNDIFKCLCGLCFGSLKKFKLHFVQCELDTSGGLHCPECTVSRRFPPEELDSHLLLHSAGIHDFRVRRICFQLETNGSDETTVIRDVENTASDVGTEDLITERDMLKDETLSQELNVDNAQPTHENHNANNSIEADLQIKRDILKDEVLSQEITTKRTDDSHSMSVETEKESLTQETIAEHIEVDQETIGQVIEVDQETIAEVDQEIIAELIEVDQETIAEVIEVDRETAADDIEVDRETMAGEIPTAEVDRDMQVKTELLKDEVLSRESVQTEESMPIAGPVIENERDMPVDLSQETMSVETTVTLPGDIDKDLHENRSFSNGQFESQPSITIEDSDSDVDSDIVFVKSYIL